MTDSTNSYPLFVSLYSTLGGISLCACLSNIPLMVRTGADNNAITLYKRKIKIHSFISYLVTLFETTMNYFVYNF